MPDYRSFSVEEFVRDPFFQQWVVQPEPVHLAFWEQWMSEHPSQQETVDQARAIVTTLKFRPEPRDNADFIAAWKAIHEATQDKGQTAWPRRMAYSKNAHTLQLRQIVLVAAGLLGVAFFLYLYWQIIAPPPQITHTTTYGETKRLTLPDGTLVMLNANSTLSYADAWETKAGSETRSVQLEGEAFFEITKRQTSAGSPIKFTVDAQDLTIAVLGTEFNVNQRGEAVQVMLTEGQVQLYNPENTVNVTMAPGELVEYSTQTNRVAQTKANAEVYTAWRENRYVFEDTALEDIRNLIENNYGKEVIITSPALLTREITATIPSTKLAVLLTILEETLGIDIVQQDNQLVFQNRNH